MSHVILSGGLTKEASLRIRQLQIHLDCQLDTSEGKESPRELSRSGCPVGMSVGIVLIVVTVVGGSNPLWMAPFSGFVSWTVQKKKK